MANNFQSSSVSWCIFFLVVILKNMLNHDFVESRHILNEKYLDLKHKGTVKTIESHEDGDVIDCVDIYKQSAFDHPLIKDLEMDPSSYPSGIIEMDDESHPELYQNWRKYGECPEGTIPIRRTPNIDFRRTLRQFNNSFQSNEADINEYAVLVDVVGHYYGGYGSINVWNPLTEEKEFSASSMNIEAQIGSAENLNVIEAGWIVFPGRYFDNLTRFFIFWTRDNGISTGCYDLGCPGFVHTNRKFAIGSPLTAISTYNGTQFEISISIHKTNIGNWWVQVQGVALGYWPGTIFTSLADSGGNVGWGGNIVNRRSSGSTTHTTTQMGSGGFSTEHYAKASYVRNLRIVNASYVYTDSVHLRPLVTNPSCYNLQLVPETHTSFGTYFYYGGPGLSPSCT